MTSSEDVVELLARLEVTGAQIVVGGGWGIDALWGTETRDHVDLDVLVSAEHESAVLGALVSCGFEVSVDWRPVRVALVDGGGRQVDVHPTAFDAEGNGVQTSLDGPAFVYPAADIRPRPAAPVAPSSLP